MIQTEVTAIVTTAAEVTRAETLAAAITDAGQMSQFWFGGWSDDIEAALLDAVFSARATYGSETTGVRKVIASWRQSRDDRKDRLAAFCEIDTAALIENLGNRQRVAGNSTTKAEAAALVAAALGSVGVRTAADVDGSDVQRDAFVSVAGVGKVSWECFLGVLDVPTPESEALIGMFVRSALDWDDIDVDSEIADAALLLDCTTATLRHAIWRVQRRR